MTSALEIRCPFSGLRMGAFGCVPLWRQSPQMTSCHPPAGESSPSSALRCWACFCHAGLCMPVLCRPCQLSLQGGQAGLTWGSYGSHLVMFCTTHSHAIQQVTLISSRGWRANDFLVSRFAWKLHIPGKLTWQLQEPEQNTRPQNLK